MKNEKIALCISIIGSIAIVTFTGIFRRISTWMSANGLLTVILGTLLLILISIVIAFIINMIIIRFISRGFVKEYNAIVKEFQNPEDGEKLYNDLIAMKKTPKTVHDKNCYYLSMSSALYHMGRFEDALENLDKISLSDPTIVQVTEAQRAELLKTLGRSEDEAESENQ